MATDSPRKDSRGLGRKGFVLAGLAMPSIIIALIAINQMPVQLPQPAASGQNRNLEFSWKCPATVAVSVRCEKKTYVLGEPAILTMKVCNTGSQAVSLEPATQYRIIASSSKGQKVFNRLDDGRNEGWYTAFPDGELTTLFPGQSFEQHIQLQDSCSFSTPGHYKIKVHAGHSWYPGAVPKNASRSCFYGTGTLGTVATTSVTFVQPDAQQTKAIAESCLHKPATPEPTKHSIFGEVVHPIVPTLTSATFLDVLYKQAMETHSSETAGRAVTGIGNIATPEATQALIKLASCNKYAVSSQAARLLSKRLPLPPVCTRNGKYSHSYIVDELPKFDRKNVWRDEFATGARHAGELAQQRGEGLIGTYIIACLAKKVDLKQLMSELDSILLATRKEKIDHDTYPYNHYAMAVLIDEIEGVARKDKVQFFPPRTPAESVIFINRTRPEYSRFRPQGWEHEYARLVLSDIPYVCHYAIEGLPAGASTWASTEISQILLDDSRESEQILLCQQILRNPGRESSHLRKPLMSIVSRSKNDWLITLALQCLDSSGAQGDAWKATLLRGDAQGLSRTYLRIMQQFMPPEREGGFS